MKPLSELTNAVHKAVHSITHSVVDFDVQIIDGFLGGACVF